MAFKVHPPSLLQRIWAGRKLAVASMMGMYTVGGVIVAIIPESTIAVLGILTALGILTVPVPVSALVGYLSGKSMALPPMLVDELSKESSYICKPCTSENLRVACDIVRPLFGSDHVDWSILEQWRLRNPKAFMQITNNDNLLTALFVILGLEDSFMDELIKGTVVESQVIGEYVQSMPQTKKMNRIYVSGIMVRDPGSYIGSKRAHVMLWCMLKYFRHHFRLSYDLVLYAVAVNKESEKLLKSLNFKVVTPAVQRKDHHNFYHIIMNEDTWAGMHQRIGNFAEMCKISY